MTLTPKQIQDANQAALRRHLAKVKKAEEEKKLDTDYQKTEEVMQAENPKKSGTWSLPPDYPEQERKPEDI